MSERIGRLAAEYDWPLSGQRDWRMERPEEIKQQCFAAGYKLALADMQEMAPPPGCTASLFADIVEEVVKELENG